MQKALHSQQYRSPLTRLRQARLKAGLKQEQLAVMLEACQEQISKCETGLRRLDVIEQKPWIEALGLQLPSVLEMLDQQSIGWTSKVGATVEETGRGLPHLGKMFQEGFNS